MHDFSAQSTNLTADTILYSSQWMEIEIDIVRITGPLGSHHPSAFGGDSLVCECSSTLSVRKPARKCPVAKPPGILLWSKMLD